MHPFLVADTESKTFPGGMFMMYKPTSKKDFFAGKHFLSPFFSAGVIFGNGIERIVFHSNVNRIVIELGTVCA